MSDQATEEANVASKVSGVIKMVRPYVRKKDNVQMVLLQITGVESPVHLSAKQVMVGAEINSNFKSLEGQTLTVDFYVKGEAMLNGIECTKETTIIKNFEFEANDESKMFAGAAAKGMGLFTR